MDRRARAPRGQPDGNFLSRGPPLECAAIHVDDFEMHALRPAHGRAPVHFPGKQFEQLRPSLFAPNFGVADHRAVRALQRIGQRVGRHGGLVEPGGTGLGLQNPGAVVPDFLPVAPSDGLDLVHARREPDLRPAADLHRIRMDNTQ